MWQGCNKKHDSMCFPCGRRRVRGESRREKGILLRGGRLEGDFREKAAFERDLQEGTALRSWAMGEEDPSRAEARVGERARLVPEGAWCLPGWSKAVEG